ncbi:MAG TPA: prepilin peptidase [Anaerovoracaceae bacterium]|nr:prepilin peptidase [Anaerovoracaceae bacterium]
MILITAFVFTLGLLIGSFLNVCIYRIPENISVAKGFSFCPTCKNRIQPYDLIPVISYLFLKGSCRHCKSHISAKYPLVELLTGVLFILVYFQFGLTPYAGLTAILVSVLVAITFIDLKHQIIPDGLSLIIFASGIPAAFLSGLSPWEHVIGFFAVSVLLLIIAFLSNGGMGGGDIKLMAAAGLFLGWKLILLSLMIASIIGAIISIGLLVLKKADRKSMVPFGPFLSIGIIISVLYGNTLIMWYLVNIVFR